MLNLLIIWDCINFFSRLIYFLLQSNCYILCEVSLDTTTLNLKCVIKMEDPGNVHSFIEVFQNCLVAE